MQEARDRWPNRCLPLLVANESGWTVENPRAFRAVWDGGERPDAVTIEFEGEPPITPPVRSHFGFGVITFNLPYVFRTPPGWNLLARGPANWPKDGVTALEGVVETDWSFANFTMNWKLTRPGHEVHFGAGDPFCMLVPQRRGDLEAFCAEIRDLSSNPRMLEEFKVFSQGRDEMQIKKFLSQFVEELEPYKTDWERHYYKGLAPSGERAPEHQVTLNLAEFERADSDGDV
jgi:hypothetical protein